MIEAQRTPYHTNMTVTRSQIRYFARGIYSPGALHYRLNQALSEQSIAAKRKKPDDYFKMQVEELQHELKRRNIVSLGRCLVIP